MKPNAAPAAALTAALSRTSTPGRVPARRSFVVRSVAPPTEPPRAPAITAPSALAAAKPPVPSVAAVTAPPRQPPSAEAKSPLSVRGRRRIAPTIT